MPKIHVAIPKNGKPMADKPFVYTNSQKLITWQFHIADPAVKWVEIKFRDKGKALFFPAASTAWKCGVAVNPKNGRVQIEGSSPVGKEIGTEIYKYYVRTYNGDPSDASTEIIGELDPEIVVDTP